MTTQLRLLLLVIFAILIGFVLSRFIPGDLVWLYAGLVSVYLIGRVL